MNKFIPEQPSEAVKVPFFDDVNLKDGWQGHTTTKSIDTLKSEIAKSISRIGGIVSGFQHGIFMIGDRKREGYQIHYAINSENGSIVPGRLDIAALPVKETRRSYKIINKKREASLRMALYMIRNAIDGLWFLQQLSPGYAPLMPWMLAKGGKTISQLWAESSVMNKLIPPGESDFIEGEIVE